MIAQLTKAEDVKPNFKIGDLVQHSKNHVNQQIFMITNIHPNGLFDHITLYDSDHPENALSIVTNDILDHFIPFNGNLTLSNDDATPTYPFKVGDIITSAFNDNFVFLIININTNTYRSHEVLTLKRYSYGLERDTKGEIRHNFGTDYELLTNPITLSN